MFNLLTVITAVGTAVAAGTLSAAPVADNQEARVDRTFDTFIAHVIAGRHKQALNLTNALNEGEQQAARLRQVKHLKDAKVVAVYADKENAIGFSSAPFVPNHRGNLVLRANRINGAWRIIDLDFRYADKSNDKIYADLGEFWYRNPDARPLRVELGAVKDKRRSDGRNLPVVDSRPRQLVVWATRLSDIVPAT
jgi:hypothetical protein